MTNFDLYKLVNFIVNKDVYAQSMSDTEFELELKSKNQRHFRRRLGLPEAFNPGSASEGAGMNRLVESDLLPFLVTETKNPVAGIISPTYLSWYYMLDFYTADSITSDLLATEEISSRLNNFILEPTIYHIAAYRVPTGLKVLPTTITSVTLVYYRKPIDPVFKVITDPVTLEMSYDINNVMELEWDDGNKLDVLNMILQDLGINLQRGDIDQMAAKLIQTGK